MRLQKRTAPALGAVAVLRKMRRQVAACVVPIVTKEAAHRQPFRVLVSCILSLRTKDQTTAAACGRLFSAAATPAAMMRLSTARIARLIYPVGFYRVKAKTIAGLCRLLVRRYAGRVPDTLQELLTIKGVGRKTANLVLGLGFGIPAICVDTHVHRISNRLGWVRTRTPEQTETALESVVPKDWWIELNTVMVTFGQNVCHPVSPLCSMCSVRESCPRKGVTQSR